MSLLRDIQDSAIDEGSQVATLLRKCKVLAVRLGSKEFGRWVDNELNGYEDLDELPSYRVLRVRSYGHFVGYGHEVKNAPIAPGVLPEEIREFSETSMINMPISALASLADAGSDSRDRWPPDVVRLVGSDIYENLNCVDAWKALPRAALIGIIDTVRTRILNFALEIESEYPDAGEAPVKSNPVPEDKVSQVFHTYITGNVQNLATGSSDFKQTATVNSGASDELFQNLLSAVMQASADAKVIAEVAGSIEEMRDARGTKKFKEHYQSFMSLLSDHMQVFGPLVAPYLPTLAQILS